MVSKKTSKKRIESFFKTFGSVGRKSPVSKKTSKKRIESNVIPEEENRK